MADNGRISSVLGEALITPPAAEAKGRISNVLGEALITPPAAETKGRVSVVLAEAAVVADTDLVRASFVFVEVFAQAPTTTASQRKALGGGVQGTRVGSIRRRR
jgi:hypothetical protein